MKSINLLFVPIALAFVSCNTGTNPISSDGYNPMRPPGTGLQSDQNISTGLRPGQFVTAAVDNTAFYKSAPKGDKEVDRLLDRGTGMKIVKISGINAKVELDSGEVGFVPTVMLDNGQTLDNELVPVDGIYQDYSLVPGNEPIVELPPLEPNTSAIETEIPAIIDPVDTVDEKAE